VCHSNHQAADPRTTPAQMLKVATTPALCPSFRLQAEVMAAMTRKDPPTMEYLLEARYMRFK